MLVTSFQNFVITVPAENNSCFPPRIFVKTKIRAHLLANWTGMNRRLPPNGTHDTVWVYNCWLCPTSSIFCRDLCERKGWIFVSIYDTEKGTCLLYRPCQLESDLNSSITTAQNPPVIVKYAPNSLRMSFAYCTVCCFYVSYQNQHIN